MKENFIVILLIPIITYCLILFLLMGFSLGVGYVISLILPLTLFQSTIICIASILVVAFVLFSSEVRDSLSKIAEYAYHNHYEEDDDEEDEDDYEEDDDDDEWDKVIPAIVRPQKSTPSGRVSRNAPCPCGSGKKYKYCCGKQNAT